MKIIEKKITHNRLFFYFLGIKLFSHKCPTNNLVVLIDNEGNKTINPKIPGLNVIFYGEYNIVKIHAPHTNFSNFNIVLYGKSKVEIMQSKNPTPIENTKIDSLYNSRTFIDEDFSCGGAHIVVDYGTKLTIGKDCMFSTSIAIRTTDGHVIYDNKNKKVISPKNVTIGNHVWIGADSKIMKGSVIPDGCIVGMNSTVTKAFTQKNSTIVGTPARVAKENISWIRDIYWIMKKNKTEAKMIEKLSKQIY